MSDLLTRLWALCEQMDAEADDAAAKGCQLYGNFFGGRVAGLRRAAALLGDILDEHDAAPTWSTDLDSAPRVPSWPTMRGSDGNLRVVHVDPRGCSWSFVDRWLLVGDLVAVAESQSPPFRPDPYQPPAGEE